MLQEQLNWRNLYFGEVQDAHWQKLRKSLKGTTTLIKYLTLKAYYLTECEKVKDDAHALRMLQVRVTNYVTALSHGGIIKPEEYKQSEV